MAFESITAAHRFTFKENFALALQEATDRFSQTFTYQENVLGEQAKLIDLMGQSEARINAPDGGSTPDIEPSTEGVWMTPVRVDWGRLVKRETEIKAAIELKSIYNRDGAAAMARARNVLLRDAFFGPRRTGKTGTTLEAYSSSTAVNLVAVDYVPTGAPVNSGLTFDKILKGIALMIKNEVDLETDELYMAVGSEEEEDLWRDVKYLSSDYTNKLVVDEGLKKVKSFMGINFVRFQRLPTTGTSRRCPLYVKSGMHYGEPVPLETTMGRDPSKQFRVQLYAEQWIGATRSEDKKVVEIRTHRP